MGKALEKFAKSKEFDTKEATKQAVMSQVPLVGGIIRGSESGHKTAGALLGPGGAAGAESKNDKKSRLAETTAGYAAGGSVLNAARGAASSSKGKGGKAALAGAASGAIGGAIGGAATYGLGKVFGKDYNAAKKEAAEYTKKKK